jgi:hypothetical protein
MIGILFEGKKKEIKCNLRNTGLSSEINESTAFPVMLLHCNSNSLHGLNWSG